MLPTSLVDILRHIAREEPLSGTVRAFPGLTREDMGRLLEAAAEHLLDRTPAPEAPVPGALEARPRRTRRSSR